MKCSLGISNFLEEISSLSHSIVFFYFFALITEEGFLISPCCSWELCIQMGISFLFSFAFHFSSFHSSLLALLRQSFWFFAFLFLGDGLQTKNCYTHCTSLSFQPYSNSIIFILKKWGNQGNKRQIFFLFFLLTVLCSLWNFSSLTRDQTCILGNESTDP